MLRTIFRAALGLWLVQAAVSWNLAAAEKAAKEIPADVKAKEEVQAALQAEATGNNERRSTLLTSARLAAPDLPEANWHAAHVRAGDAWLPLGQVVAQTAGDSNEAKYRELRAKAVGSVRAVRELARWCQKQGWVDRARLHYAQVLSLPNADSDVIKDAVKALDLQRVGAAWLTRAEIADRAAAAKQAEIDVEKWRPRLKKLQVIIDSDDFKRRDQARDEFRQLDDPAILPVLPSFLADGGDRFQEECALRLAHFPQYEATIGLVKFAVLSDFGIVRTAAINGLRTRPIHEYVPALLSGLTAPIKSQFQVNWNPLGRIDYRHAFLREGPSGNLLLMAHGLALPSGSERTIVKNDTVRVYAPEVPKQQVTNTTVGISKQEAFLQQRDTALASAAVTEAQVQLLNNATEISNERLFTALEQATNQQLPREPVQWWNWWQGYNEYQWPRPTTYLYQSSAQSYYYGLTTLSHVTGTRGYSCFVAGTPVRTASGQVPIESIRPGDRVLAQDPDTGELTFKVVLTTTLRPPAKMLRISAGDDKIVTTLGHPFWVNGHGWKMAKELATGDLLHGLGGATPIEKVEQAREDQAYNLVVEDFNTYFVGQQGLLVHDNEFRKPTRAIVPGLVEELAVAAKK